MSSPMDTGLLNAPDPIDYDEAAQDLRERYEAIEARDIDPIEVIPKRDATDTGVDVANLLFGDEMASVGISVDRKGFNWQMETAKDFWSEHPVRAALATATTLLPLAGAARGAWKAGKTAGYGDDVLRQSGLVDEGVDLAAMNSRDREILELNMDHAARDRERTDQIERLGDAAPLKERAFASMHKYFGNKYIENMDPLNAPSVRAEWRNATGKFLQENGNFAYHLDKVPPPEVGTKIASYLADPKRLADVPAEHRDWAIRIADDLRGTQTQMINEGFLATDEAAKIGDVWFSTLREGTQVDAGKMSMLLDNGPRGARVLSVPRTRSPNLLKRKASREEVREHVNKQMSVEALSAGRTDEALSLLKGEGYSDARKLIESGETGKAIKLLSTGGKIDFSPESLVFNSVFQQKMLLSNFRMIRDLATNPDITKSAEYVMSLAPGARKKWVNLDTLENSDRVRRMVGRKKGLEDAVESLGYVPKSVFRELQDITGEAVSNGHDGLLRLITALHKTAKTAYNVPTQIANGVGNFAFLVNAGINPFSREFLGLQKQSFGAVAKLQRAARQGKSIEDLGDMGMIPSKVGTAPIKLRDELASNELTEIVELSSITSAEGLNVLESLARADDFVGEWARLANKAIDKTKGYVPADLYTRTDGAMKMAYFLHLRQRGFSRAGAAMEVGRRMPMYHTVGEAPAAARSWMLPWVTFPAEAARILKNNLMDHPLKTALTLQIPELAQVGMYGAAQAMGRGMSADSVGARKEQLASWANKPSTIITPFQDSNEDFRAMVLDFLPFSSIMPPTISSEAPTFKKLPFGLDDPLPIFRGIANAMTGQDSWGREVPTDPNQPWQKVTTMALSTMGFIAPPLADKYLFNPTEVQTGYRFLQDAGKRVNPYTEQAGDPLFDLLVNNVSPMKMYPSNPNQQLANESFSQGRISKFRSRLTREWSALLKSGDVEGAADKMRDIMQTFSSEAPQDPAIAQQKMNQWLKSHTQQLRTHPQLRRFSKKELAFRIDQLESSAASQRSRARMELIEAHRKELRRRGRNSQGGRMNPLLPASILEGGGGVGRPIVGPGLL